MKQRNNPAITKMFKGFRIGSKKIGGKVESMPLMPRQELTKSLFKKLEKITVLTLVQHKIVAIQLDKCTEKTDPIHIARLSAILEKAVGGQNESMG